jgi:uncharacterized protein
MTDVTPRIPADVKVIQSYSDKGFRISGQDYPAAVLLSGAFARGVEIESMADFSAKHLSLFDGLDAAYLLLGCGSRAVLPAPDMMAALKARGIVAEPMTTGAACRTYNVLLGEGRKVAALLLPAG